MQNLLNMNALRQEALYRTNKRVQDAVREIYASYETQPPLR